MLKQHIWFLSTQNPTLKKPKELFLPTLEKTEWKSEFFIMFVSEFYEKQNAHINPIFNVIGHSDQYGFGVRKFF